MGKGAVVGFTRLRAGTTIEKYYYGNRQSRQNREANLRQFDHLKMIDVPIRITDKSA